MSWLEGYYEQSHNLTESIDADLAGDRVSAAQSEALASMQNDVAILADHLGVIPYHQRTSSSSDDAPPTGCAVAALLPLAGLLAGLVELIRWLA